MSATSCYTVTRKHTVPPTDKYTLNPNSEIFKPGCLRILIPSDQKCRDVLFNIVERLKHVYKEAIGDLAHKSIQYGNSDSKKIDFIELPFDYLDTISECAFNTFHYNLKICKYSNTEIVGEGESLCLIKVEIPLHAFFFQLESIS